MNVIGEQGPEQHELRPGDRVHSVRSHRAPSLVGEAFEGIGIVLVGLAVVAMIVLLFAAGLGDAIGFILSYVVNG